MAGRRTRSNKSKGQRKAKSKKKARATKHNTYHPSSPLTDAERRRSRSVDSAQQLRNRLNATTLSDSSRPSTSSTTSSGRKRRSTVTEAEDITCPSAKRQPRLQLMSIESNMSGPPHSYSPNESDPSCRAILEEEEYERDQDSDEVDTAPSSSGEDNEDAGSVFSKEDEANSDALSDLENKEFVDVEKALNNSTLTEPVPPQLTAKSSRGVGMPSEVWNLLCCKNEVIRPDKNVLFEAKHITEHIRSVLIDWMMEVCENEKQHRETFHLAVDYVDRYLACDKTLTVDSFQCIGTTALFIASKYEEIYPPKLEQLVEYTDDACDDEQVRETEMIMLHTLNWSLTAVTSIHWLNIFLQLLGSKNMKVDKHASDQPCVVPKYLRDEYVNMAKVLDLVLLEVNSLQYSYRELAAAVLFACYEPHSLVQQVTGYSYERILPAVEWVEPCVRVQEKSRSFGDPLPCFDDVRCEEWHNIQTHFHSANANITDLRKAVFLERKEREKKKQQMEQAKARARTSIRAKATPLRVRRNGPVVK